MPTCHTATTAQSSALSQPLPALGALPSAPAPLVSLVVRVCRVCVLTSEMTIVTNSTGVKSNTKFNNFKFGMSRQSDKQSLTGEYNATDKHTSRTDRD
jgi:hypothetical protein